MGRCACTSAVNGEKSETDATEQKQIVNKYTDKINFCDAYEGSKSGDTIMNTTDSIISTKCSEIRMCLCLVGYVSGSLFMYTQLINYLNSVDLSGHIVYIYLLILFISNVWYSAISVVSKLIPSCRQSVSHPIINI